MFKTIIWATDGSESADLALPYAKQLAETDCATMMVVHCEEFMVGPKASGYTVHPDEDDLKEKIDRQVKDLAAEGCQTSYKLVGSKSGGAAHRIAEVADEVEADLIVVGTRGHTALGGLLLGSVTQRLLFIGPCPVLAVPTVSRPVEEPKPIAFQASS
jgi:nucleotide-binding universal stress UspA family protein